MAVDFSSPSYRASSGDLTIQISPLGLVELSDEEFEVHGPRLNRYAHNWGFYLGHHWGYRREVGEPQLTFNYVKAFSDYTTNFVFGKGVSWRSPQATEAIVPGALEEVWSVHNNKAKILWEIGQLGSVSGDTFVKVAFEEPYQDSAGLVHEGRVRIIPLNPAFCFPEFHPHDRHRMIRFKLKYRFWGTALEGTRQVFTYTELVTDDYIEEYINDELIDARPNPIGEIPIVHIPNLPVSSSPWGLADIQEIIPLNREYNEKATDISDIINYHAEPVTVITGAKASHLEKGSKKVWGGLPKDAQVFNLELGAGLEGPMAYLQLLKTAMHELTGVPESALGQMQPISNTSGVALAIQYQPLMNRWALKKTQYADGLERINALVMKHLFIYMPQETAWDPNEDAPLKDGQYEVLDPMDPISYRSTAHFPEPLPLDVLIKLNEVQGKMALGLESKRGALRTLGEEFVDEKLEELTRELRQDTLEQGALDLMRAQIEAAIMHATGMVPDGSAPQEPSAGGPGVTSASGSNGSEGAGEGGGAVGAPGAPAGIGMSEDRIMDALNEMVTASYGTKLPQRRNPDNTD